MGICPCFHDVAKRIAGLDPDIEQTVISDESADTVWAKVPDITGLRTGEAKALLKNMNIPFKTNGSGSWIIDQKPSGGTVLEKSEKIILTQSTTPVNADTSNLGKGNSIVPDVVGMSMRKAAALINKQGFDVRFIGSGTIYQQYPEAGESLNRGLTVIIRGREPSLNQLSSSKH